MRTKEEKANDRLALAPGEDPFLCGILELCRTIDDAAERIANEIEGLTSVVDLLPTTAKLP